MRVEFDFTAEDLLDVTLRGTNFAQLERGLEVLLLPSYLAALAVVITVATHLSSHEARIAVLGSAVLCSFLWRRIPKRWARRTIERQVATEMAGAPSARCIVELHDERLLWHQSGRSGGWEWRCVSSIKEQGSDIGFHGMASGESSMLSVRGRAFATPAERTAFLARARALQVAARAGGPVSPATPSASAGDC